MRSTTSGRAVLFAGITVIISLLGLFIIGLAFVHGLAIASALSVLVMMIAAITLLPALHRLRRSAHREDDTRGRASLSGCSSCSRWSGCSPALRSVPPWELPS